MDISVFHGFCLASPFYFPFGGRNLEAVVHLLGTTFSSGLIYTLCQDWQRQKHRVHGNEVHFGNSRLWDQFIFSFTL